MSRRKTNYQLWIGLAFGFVIGFMSGLIAAELSRIDQWHPGEEAVQPAAEPVIATPEWEDI